MENSEGKLRTMFCASSGLFLEQNAARFSKSGEQRMDLRSSSCW